MPEYDPEPSFFICKACLANTIETNSVMNVFIDTSIYKKLHFIFIRHQLLDIRKLASTGTIKLFTTSITTREVRKHLKEKCRETKTAINALFDGGKFLNAFTSFDHVSSALKGLRATIDKDATELFDDFLSDCKAIEIPFGYVDSTAIFDRYFEQSPPFGSSGKKHEFPDAFVIEALGRWCTQNREPIYVISDDGDFKAACERFICLIYLPDIPSFLEIHMKESVEEGIVRLAYSMFDKASSAIDSKMLECLKEAEIQSDQWYTYSDDISEIQILSVSTVERKLVGGDEVSSEFKLVLTVHIRATHNMNNPRSAVPAPDGDFLYLEGVTFQQEHEVTVRANVQLAYWGDQDQPATVDLSLEDELIEVSTDESLENVDILDIWANEL